MSVEDPTSQAGTLKSLLNNSNYIKGFLTMSQAVSYTLETQQQIHPSPALLRFTRWRSKAIHQSSFGQNNSSSPRPPARTCGAPTDPRGTGLDSGHAGLPGQGPQGLRCGDTASHAGGAGARETLGVQNGVTAVFCFKHSERKHAMF